MRREERVSPRGVSFFFSLEERTRSALLQRDRHRGRNICCLGTQSIMLPDVGIDFQITLVTSEGY